MEEESLSEVNVGSQGSAGPPPSISKPLPLNSKRLKVAFMKRIATSMSLPTAGSADDVRQMIEGQLTEMGKEPQRVQVLVSGESGRIHLDVDGPFLDVEPEEESGSSTHDDDEEQDLESALHESRELTAQLQEEVSALPKGTNRARERVREVWRNSCNQLREFDVALESKDEEIAHLKSRLQGLCPGEDHEIQSESVQSHVPPRPRR